MGLARRGKTLTGQERNDDNKQARSDAQHFALAGPFSALLITHLGLYAYSASAFTLSGALIAAALAATGLSLHAQRPS